MYFTGQSLETASELERILGKYEYKDKDGHKVVRNLMTNDEIRMMKINRALLICGHHPPIKARLTPYYKNVFYSGYSKLPVPNLQNKMLIEHLFILPTEILKKGSNKEEDGNA